MKLRASGPSRFWKCPAQTAGGCRTGIRIADGSQIAYIRGRAESEIWLMDGNGENPELSEGAHETVFTSTVVTRRRPDRHTQVATRGDNPSAIIETVPRTGELKLRFFRRRACAASVVLRRANHLFNGRAAPNDRGHELVGTPVDSSAAKAIGNPRRITNWAGLSLSDLSLSSDSNTSDSERWKSE